MGRASSPSWAVPDNAGFIDQYREAFGPSGRASFDYTRNNGDYTLWGDHARSICFQTHWSSAASQVIHAYDEKNYVALALGAAQFNDVDDPSALEFDSRFCTARRGQIVVFRNEIGFALVKVENVLPGPERGDSHTELEISYQMRLPD